jgi:hypothetical protein
MDGKECSMPRQARRAVSAGILVLTALASFAFGQANLSLKDIFEKNILASGGREKLAAVKSLSFRTGGTFHCLQRGAKVVWVGAVATESSRPGRQVQRNSFGTVTEVTGSQQVIQQTLPGSTPGFSLPVRGPARVGRAQDVRPGQTPDLTMTAALRADFFVNADDFFLKRLLFQAGPEGDTYESITTSRLSGTAGLFPAALLVQLPGRHAATCRADRSRVQSRLDESFFKSLEVNIGTTEAAPGVLKGNVLDFNSSPFGLTITTNWTRKEIEQAGFRTTEKLTFLIEGMEAEIDFYAAPNEIPGPDVLSKGARFLAPATRGGATFAIQLVAVDTASIAAKLKPLVPISVKRK